MHQPYDTELPKFLINVGVANGAGSVLPTSTATFPDGAPYHIEIPSVEGPEALRAVLGSAEAYGIRIHRISQGSGIMMQTDDEITEMLQLGREHSVEICLFVGPRAEWDIGVQASTVGGGAVAATLRGREQLFAALEDVRHGCELGLRSILVADLGQLWLLGKMRAQGLLPSDLKIKVSASMPAANPATARVLEDLGADTINVPVDLTVEQLAGLRSAIEVPIDIYIEAPDTFGAPVRYYDVPEIVRVAAPLHLKFAVRNAASLYPYGRHLRDHAIDTGRERVRRAKLATQIIERAASHTARAAAANGHPTAGAEPALEAAPGPVGRPAAQPARTHIAQ
jgi:hypothetical protein